VIYRLAPTLDPFIADLPATDDPAEARVVVLGSQPLDLSRFPKLRGIFRVGVGTENVPFAEAAARGIEIGLPSAKNVELLYDEVAAFACHLVLRVAYADAGSIEGWQRPPRQPLRDNTLLVIGRGHVGRRVATTLQVLMNVRTFDARRPRAELHSALSEGDVVSLHIPLADNTRGLIGAPELAALRDGAALVNISRGALVDEQALLAEIRSGRLRAAFDVFWQEPYDGPLAAFHPDRFYMTPHVAGASRAFLAASAENLRAFVQRLIP
jgi:phosphoglycerate dehydrogenase-like enzyme